MKKKILFVVVLGIASYTFASVFSSESINSALLFDEIEAISSCEVSSNASKNQGYCVANYGSAGDTCVERGEGGSVRCSGNF